MNMKVKKIVSFLLFLFLTAGFAVAQNKKDSKSEKDTVLFHVSMTCDNCKKRIEKNIAFEKGVTNMDVNLSEKTVKVEFKKNKTSVEKLKTAIEKLGYEATVEDNNNQKEQNEKI